MKKLPRPGEGRPEDAPGTDTRTDPRPGGADATPYSASRLPDADDSLALPGGLGEAPARVDIAAAIAAAGLVPGGAGGAGTPGPVPGDGDRDGAGDARGGAPRTADPARRGRRPGAGQSLPRRRRFARERAVQALYQWHMSGASSSEVRGQFLATQEMDRVDVDYFEAAFRGVTLDPETVDATLGQSLDRELAEVDPIERAILRLATWELASRADVPAAVIVSEAVEIAGRFCAEPGRRYVNGVADALAARLRAAETGRA